MNYDTKKLIVFDQDKVGDEPPGRKRFIKFLDEKKGYAIFYEPVIAPQNFESYLKNNNILIGYEILDNEHFLKYQDNIYTFLNEDGVYVVSKGYHEETKYLLLVDKGMEICLDLPTYSYSFLKDGLICVEKIKNASSLRNYCYLAPACKVNDALKSFMTKVTEIVPGIIDIKAQEKSEKLVKKRN